jgi:glucokinase
MLVRAPHLSSWVDAPIARELHKALRVPIVLENDALLNAMGEAVYGAGKKYSIVGFLTISTGVNGARIISGQPDVGAFPYELGLLPVHGVTIESLASGHGLHGVHHRHPEELSDTAWRSVERSLSIALTELALIWRPEIFVLAGPMVRAKKIQPKRIHDLVEQRWQHPSPVPSMVPADLDDVSGLWGALAFTHLHSEAIFGRVEQRPT